MDFWTLWTLQKAWDFTRSKAQSPFKSGQQNFFLDRTAEQSEEKVK
jgi:hypothetical protein